MADLVRVTTRRRWLAGAACGVAVLAHPLACAADAAAEVATPAATGAAVKGATRPLEGLGVELMAVRLTASDFMIDLRYRVKDVGRAQALLEQKVRPVLVNVATGDRYYVPQAPKVGSLKQSATAKQPAIVDRIYFMLFANPDRRLKAGEKVTLYAGDSVVEDIVVQ
jgi:hypothetical protein